MDGRTKDLNSHRIPISKTSSAAKGHSCRESHTRRYPLSSHHHLLFWVLAFRKVTTNSLFLQRKLTYKAYSANKAKRAQSPKTSLRALVVILLVVILLRALVVILLVVILLRALVVILLVVILLRALVVILLVVILLRALVVILLVVILLVVILLVVILLVVILLVVILLVVILLHVDCTVHGTHSPNSPSNRSERNACG